MEKFLIGRVITGRTKEFLQHYISVRDSLWRDGDLCSGERLNCPQSNISLDGDVGLDIQYAVFLWRIGYRGTREGVGDVNFLTRAPDCGDDERRDL